jgi:ABC-type transport system involved in Fe-S cluster assembly fused permease/ATPase subunit
MDALINYETVKYFGGESGEVARYDTSLLQYVQRQFGACTARMQPPPGRGPLPLLCSN